MRRKTIIYLKLKGRTKRQVGSPCLTPFSFLRENEGRAASPQTRVGAPVAREGAALSRDTPTGRQQTAPPRNAPPRGARLPTRRTITVSTGGALTNDLDGTLLVLERYGPVTVTPGKAELALRVRHTPRVPTPQVRLWRGSSSFRPPSETTEKPELTRLLLSQTHANKTTA